MTIKQLKLLIIGALLVLTNCLNAQKSSASTSVALSTDPYWIVSPEGDTLMVLTLQQVDVLGEKLILLERLVVRNFEVDRDYDLCVSRCNALATAVEAKSGAYDMCESQNDALRIYNESLKNENAQMVTSLQRASKGVRVWRGISIGLGAAAVGLIIKGK